MTSTAAVIPRQAPTTDAPDAPPADLRAALAPGLDIFVNGDSYPLPDTGSVTILQPDGASIVLEPSAVVANGQSSTIPLVTSATPLTVGGIDMTAPGSEGVTCNPHIPDYPWDGHAVSYPENAFEAAAHQFCYGPYNAEANPSDGQSGGNYFWFSTDKIDPATNLPAYCLGMAHPSGGWIPERSAQDLCISAHGPSIYGSNSKIRVLVVPSPSQDGCSPLGKYKLPQGEACVTNLRNVIFECMLDNKKSSAGVWRESTPQGCWDWYTWGLPLYP
ncbi:hypothetical protein PRZ48_012597 [Zasmidium cellare]|uniref:Uncharacterized protein n=1 Tax=Zasmidium cellare TaxID=395010 RepID=A0ABR0E5B5_ZASCE|nr:hypothetical protein PRZ48_012597 [Zasmidium cellare]